MNPFHGWLLWFLATLASIALRAPHARGSRQLKVVQSRKGALEVALLVAMGIAVLALPLLAAPWSGILAFADHALPAWAFALGAGFVVLWLWLFYRSHADLGQNWSVTLELRDGHQLVTQGVYAHVRHPMYTALFCQALAQALLVANWIAGPAMVAVFTLMFATRLGPEERMMREAFGEEYEAYARRTKRLVPGVW